MEGRFKKSQGVAPERVLTKEGKKEKSGEGHAHAQNELTSNMPQLRVANFVGQYGHQLRSGVIFEQRIEQYNPAVAAKPGKKCVRF